MLKLLLLPTLIVVAVLSAFFGLAAGGSESHGLLFAGVCAAFLASDRSLWSTQIEPRRFRRNVASAVRS